MELDEYQDWTDETAIYKTTGGLPGDLVYPTLGLAGEAGEVAEVVKKFLRDGMQDQWRSKLIDEMGDVLYYLARVGKEAGIKLSEVRDRNVLKLEDRKQRGKLHGSGSNR